MNENQGEKGDSRRLSRLLDKYVAVWLWSILFGATAGVGFSVLSIRSGNWGQLGSVLVIPGVIVLGFTAGAWIHLYRGFRRYLLPAFFGEDSEQRVAREFQYSLARAFYFLFMASLMRIAGWILELTLNALAR